MRRHEWHRLPRHNFRFNPDEPRDPKGEWTSGGDGAPAPFQTQVTVSASAGPGSGKGGPAPATAKTTTQIGPILSQQEGHQTMPFLQLCLAHRLPILFDNDDTIRWSWAKAGTILHIEVTEEDGTDMKQTSVYDIPRNEIKAWCECKTASTNLWAGADRPWSKNDPVEQKPVAAAAAAGRSAMRGYYKRVIKRYSDDEPRDDHGEWSAAEGEPLHGTVNAASLQSHIENHVDAQLKLWGSVAKKGVSQHDIDYKIVPGKNFSFSKLDAAAAKVGLTFGGNEWDVFHGNKVGMDLFSYGNDASGLRVDFFVPKDVVTEAQVTKTLKIARSYSLDTERRFNDDEPRDPHGMWTSGGEAFVSPSKEEAMKFGKAVANLRSPEHQAFIDRAKQLATSVDPGATVTSTIGTWTDGAENSSLLRFGLGATQNDIQYVACKLGLEAQQRAVLTFTRGEGNDTLWRFDTKGPLEEVQAKLQQHGLDFDTFEIGKGGESTVTIFDEGSKLASNVQGAASEYGSNVFLEKGKGSFIGGETREAGAEAFRPVIAAYEAQHGVRSQDDRSEGRPSDHGDSRCETVEEMTWRAKAVSRLAAADTRYFECPSAILRYSEDQPRDSHGEWTSGGDVGPDARISPRNPNAVKSTEDPMAGTLIANREAVRNSPGLAAKLVEKFEHYPGLQFTAAEKKDPEKALDKVETFMVGNLKFLYSNTATDVRDAAAKWYDTAQKTAQSMAQKYGVTPVQAAGVIAAMSPQKDWDQNVSLANRVLSIYSTQQDTKTSPEMIPKGQAIIAKGQKGGSDAAAQKELANILPQLDGKTLGQLSGVQQSVWIRLYDETNNDRSYNRIDPNGNDKGTVLKGNGQPWSVAWGSFKQIGNAVGILRDGSKQSINDQLGTNHKVRSFYNNIVDPNSKYGDVTIDTHAVGAALLRSISGMSTEAKDNFGGVGSNITGVHGTYSVYADAYRTAAKELGVQPRQLQSITWEAIRGIMSRTFKSQSKNVDAIDSTWKDYASGKITADQARKQVVDTAGGFAKPWWAG